MNPFFNQHIPYIPPYLMEYFMHNRPEIRQFIPPQMQFPIPPPMMPPPLPNPPIIFNRDFRGNAANPIFIDSDSDDDVQILPHPPIFEPPPPPPPPLPTRELSFGAFHVTIPVFPEEFNKAYEEALKITPYMDLSRCSDFLERAVHVREKVDNLLNRLLLAANDHSAESSFKFQNEIEKFLSNAYPSVYMHEIKKVLSYLDYNLKKCLDYFEANEKYLRKMKNSRPKKDKFPVTDIVLAIQIIQYYKTWEENKQKAEKQKRFEEAAQKHELIECECCYEEKLFEDMSQCPEGHLFCKDCLEKSVQNLIGEGRSDVRCLSALSNCTEMVSVDELARCVPEKLLKNLFVMESQNAVAAANLPGLVKCYKCGFEATIDGSGTFRCPECDAETCPGCGEQAHPGLSCEAFKAIDKNRVIEEKMNEAVIRVCPKCNAQFMKEEGCNKMECPRCHTWICYWCRKEIPKDVGYNHFWRQQGICPPDKCPLWVQNETLHQIEVQIAKEKGQLHGNEKV
ncbi:IBR domain containing protein [Tritrichomonas foetus]|uniref:IBR domain containing protein n=1 Tax=Tritrichomonas foetus TaxID=1144522 RepID=A0A1J4JY40_9EUKA|nr:IBR domain containing protein [Tritrichomonas foetus]|eukprot:OHT04079.1 IBR domain containing protein [Tritrichomonas foetus]